MIWNLENLSGKNPIMATIKIWLFRLLALASTAQAPLWAADLPAYMKKVETFLVSNQYDEAIKLAQKIEKSHGKSAALKGLIASAYMYKGDNPAAEKEAQQALQIDSKSYEAHWVLSNVYMALGKPELSAREYQLSMKYQSRKYCKPCAKKLVPTNLQVPLRCLPDLLHWPNHADFSSMMLIHS